MDMISIQKAAIFHGMDETEVNEAILFLHAEEKVFRKGQLIFHAGKGRMRYLQKNGIPFCITDHHGSREDSPGFSPKL